MRSPSPSIRSMAARSSSSFAILWVLLLLFVSLGYHGLVSSTSDDGIKKVSVRLNLHGPQSSKEREKKMNPNTCLAPRFRRCTSCTWARSTTTTPKSSRRCTTTRFLHSLEGLYAAKTRALFSWIELLDANNWTTKREAQ